MGMVVRTNMGAINANNALTKNNSTVNKNIEKLSSGMRINRAADDASGLAISEKMKALQDEVDQLCAEIDRIATTANFNNLKLMDGSLDSGISSAKCISQKIGADTVTNGVCSAATVTSAAVTTAKGASLVLQIGETSGADDKLSVDVMSFKTNYLFNDISTSVTSGTGSVNLLQANGDSKNDLGVTVNISNQNAASVAAEKVRTVIDKVSSQRAELGAQQNRLEYTVNNLTTTSENISAANSRIRDTDMAKEMMKYTQGNVLTQAAQAMLAQANQAPQGVLQLLQ
jgi:flagellin